MVLAGVRHVQQQRRRRQRRRHRGVPRRATSSCSAASRTGTAPVRRRATPTTGTLDGADRPPAARLPDRQRGERRASSSADGRADHRRRPRRRPRDARRGRPGRPVRAGGRRRARRAARRTRAALGPASPRPATCEAALRGVAGRASACCACATSSSTTEEEADAVVAELDDGADFAELAAERSIDAGRRPNGGALELQAGQPCLTSSRPRPSLDATFVDGGRGRRSPGTPTGPVRDAVRLARHPRPAVRRGRRRRRRRSPARQLLDEHLATVPVTVDPRYGRVGRRRPRTVVGSCRDAAASIVVGLGPGGDEHVTAETLAAIDRIPHRYLRTARHPSAHLVGDGRLVRRRSTRRPTLRRRLPGDRRRARRRGDRARRGALRRARLAARARAHRRACCAPTSGSTCDVLPALSFLDVAWARLGIDPVEAGVRLVDGHDVRHRGRRQHRAAAHRPHPRRLGAVGHQAGRRGRHRRRAGRRSCSASARPTSGSPRRRGASSTAPSSPTT